jgi:D-beta-D-heptose 7-phosphate kinase/D-beta-D-heptose 1-phosphate adenosyltransferase
MSGLRDAVAVADAIIVSDYNKGVVTSEVMRLLREAAAERDVMILVDPKPSNSAVYGHASLVTPNRKEASALSDIEIEDIDSAMKAASIISAKFDIENVLVTMGRDGMVLWRRGMEPFTIPTTAKDVFDVTGAGDTVIALMGMGTASGLSLKQSAMLANIAAGIVVGKVGTATVDMEELNMAVSIHMPG